MAPRYESGGEAQALVRPARDRGLPLPKTCADHTSDSWYTHNPCRISSNPCTAAPEAPAGSVWVLS